MFSEQDFLNAQTQGANSTKRTALPIGTYVAVIGPDLKVRETQGKKDPTKVYYFLDLPLEIQLPPDVQAELKRPNSTYPLKYGFSLDLTESGALDMSEGANVQLGRVRKALGQNDPTRPWAPAHMVGQQLRVEIKHRIDGEDTFADVDKVLPPV